MSNVKTSFLIDLKLHFEILLTPLSDLQKYSTYYYNIPCLPNYHIHLDKSRPQKKYYANGKQTFVAINSGCFEKEFKIVQFIF